MKVSVLVTTLAVVVVGDSLPDDGSGKTYLEKTETGWDGKTAWFTGSSKCHDGVRWVISNPELLLSLRV